MMISVIIAEGHNDFAPGIVRHATPPMGWRSWNKWECEITQEIMVNTLKALTTPHMLSNGSNATLLALGYDHAGIDVRFLR